MMKNGSRTTIELAKEWIKEGEKAQAIVKSGLTMKKVMLCEIGRESFMIHYELIAQFIKQFISNSIVNNWRNYNKQLRGSGQN